MRLSTLYKACQRAMHTRWKEMYILAPGVLMTMANCLNRILRTWKRELAECGREEARSLDFALWKAQNHQTSRLGVAMGKEGQDGMMPVMSTKYLGRDYRYSCRRAGSDISSS